MNNALSRSVDKVPAWIVQAITGLLLTSMLAWGAWATTTAMHAETRVSVLAERVDTIKSDLAEIKESQKEMNRKLDRLLVRSPDDYSRLEDNLVPRRRQ